MKNCLNFVLAFLLTMGMLVNNVGSEDGAFSNAQGEVVILHADNFERGVGEYLYFFKDSETGEILELETSEKLHKKFRTGDKIKVKGNKNGKKLYLEENAVPFESGISTDGTEAAILPAVAGEQKTLVIINDFVDVSVMCPVDEIENLMFYDTNNYSVDGLYRKTSSETTWFTGEVVGPYTIDFYSDSETCDINGWSADADAQLELDGIDISSYNRRVYVLPRDNPCGWSGLGMVGGNPSMSWIFLCDRVDVYAHEVGHNLGMHHSSTLTAEYGDISDIMGYGGWGLRAVNAPHREQMGWNLNNEIIDVNVAGIYEIDAFTTEYDLYSGPQVLKISKPDTEEFYYLSYRKAIDQFDEQISEFYMNKTNVHLYDGSGLARQTYFLDALVNDSVFPDPINGITFRQILQTETSATVEVLFDDINCEPAPLTIDVTDGIYEGDAGVFKDYYMNITNNDNLLCGQSFIEFNMEVPDGWYKWFYSAVSLRPGETEQIRVRLHSPVDEPAGENIFYLESFNDNQPLHSSSTALYYNIIQEDTCEKRTPIMVVTPTSYIADAGSSVSYDLKSTNTDEGTCDNSTFTFSLAVPDGWSGTVEPSSNIFIPGQEIDSVLTVTSDASASAGVYDIAVNLLGTDAIHTLVKNFTYEVASSPDPQCERGQPIINVTPSNHSVYAGDTAEYSVVIENSDTEECEDSTFSIGVGVPDGWLGNMTQSEIMIAPGQSYSTTLTVTSVLVAEQGIYEIAIDLSGVDVEHITSAIASYEVLAKPDTFGSIGGRVWRDLNGDGIQDADESGIFFVTVRLNQKVGDCTNIDSNDNLIDIKLTSPDGSYLFTDLNEGSYCVDPAEDTVPNGFVSTTGNDPETVDLAHGGNVLNVDFGYRYPPTDPKGYVVSSSVDYSTNDTEFLYGSVMYVKIWDEDIDHTNMNKAEYEVKIEGKRVKGLLVNVGDGTFTAAITMDFAIGNGKIKKLKLEDNFKNKFEVKDVLISILRDPTPPNPEDEKGFNVSKNSDFSTMDTAFVVSDTMYLKIWDEDVDYTNMDKFEYKVKVDGKEVKGNLINNNDGTFTATIPMSAFGDKRGDGKVDRLKIEDKNDNKYEVRDYKITLTN